MRKLRNLKNGVHHIVKANGCLMPERWSTEDKAIAQAQDMIADGYDCIVVMVVKSGTEQTATTVWPAIGQCYSLD
jgi:hypothetical protein